MTTWQRVRGDTGGTVAALAVATAHDGRAVVFAATPVGVFRSGDGGASWQLPGRQGTVAFAEAVAVSPRFADDRVVFACGSDGLHRSTDGGDTWHLVLVGSHLLGVATSTTPSGGVQVLAATETDGVLRSEDNGATWTGANAGLLDLTAMCLGMSPAFESDHRGFVGTASGLYRTRNGAQSWRAVESGLDDPAVQCLAVSPAFAHDGLVLAGTEADGVLRSEDGGTTWDCPADLATDGVTALAFSADYPAHPTIAAATASGVVLSRDGGLSWQPGGAGPASVLSLTWLPDSAGEVLLAGLEQQGVAVSRDEGATWNLSTSGLSASLLTGLTLSPAFDRDRTLFALGLDSGVNVSQDGGQTWAVHNRGLDEVGVLSLAVSPAYASDRSLFAATTSGIYISRDATESWTLAEPTPARIVATAQPALAVAASAQVVLAAAASGLLVSDDSAATWRTLTTPFGDAEILALAVSPALAPGQTLFALTRAGDQMVLWRGLDGGARWSRWLVEPSVDASGPSLAVSPNYVADELVFVALAGRVLTPMRHAREVHAGQRRPVWHAARLAMPDVAITALALSPNFTEDKTVFASSNAGVFVSHDAAHTFRSMSDGLDPPRMVAVAPSPAYATDREVYALGLGGTIWRTTDSLTVR